VTLLDTGTAVALQTRRVLGGNLSNQPMQQIRWFSTGQTDLLDAAALAWLGLQANSEPLHI